MLVVFFIEWDDGVVVSVLDVLIVVLYKDVLDVGEGKVDVKKGDVE